MSNIWSENQYVNAIINILLFAMGINVFHYGQLILPVICFILFLDRKLKFYVNDAKVFVILCLFAVSFYAFSNKDFYSVMGFCLPMAYYIGSNMNNHDAESVKKVIYLLALSMACHVCLNFWYEYHMPYKDTIRGFSRISQSSSHYDFWTKGSVSSTATAININLMIGCLYYLFRHEKKKIVTAVMFFVLFTGMAYCVMMGRRTPVLMIGAVIVLSFLFECFIVRNMTEKARKVFFFLAGSGLILLIIVLILSYFDVMGIGSFLGNTYIVAKLKMGLVDRNRFDLFLAALKLLPKYPWGGQKISAEIGLWIHEFWLDIYDYAGIVSYLLILSYSVIYLLKMIKALGNRNCDGGIRTLLLCVFFCIAAELFIEPVMTGESLFAIVAVIFGAVCEGMLIHEKQ